MIANWPCPLRDGTATEFALAFDRGRRARVLIVPALFDEGNRLRRMTVEAMRCLDERGMDTFLPDLPGLNESAVPLASVTLPDWQTAMDGAARHFGATHALAIRAGALMRPALPGADYAPVKGVSVLRQLLRARVLAAQEQGRTETVDSLLRQGKEQGLDLAGYPLGATMIAALEGAVPDPAVPVIAQADIGGGGLWLRAEPDEAPEQSRALADRLAARVLA